MGKEQIIKWIITLILKRLGSDDLKRWIDAGLDMLEDKVKQSPTKYDDMVVLPLIAVFRDAIGIE